MPRLLALVSAGVAAAPAAAWLPVEVVGDDGEADGGGHGVVRGPGCGEVIVRAEGRRGHRAHEGHGPDLVRRTAGGVRAGGGPDVVREADRRRAPRRRAARAVAR